MKKRRKIVTTATGAPAVVHHCAPNKIPSVFYAGAYVNDRKAMDALLEPLSHKESIRQSLTGVCFGQLWDPETNRDYWIGCDGKIVHCYTVAGLTETQAMRVRKRFDDVKESAVLGEELLVSFIEAETGFGMDIKKEDA